jgi:uncharacterized protein (TIGR03437 family)
VQEQALRLNKISNAIWDRMTFNIAVGAAPGNDSRIPKPQLPVSVTVGNLPAQIAFIGIVPGIAGVTEINYIIPANVRSGVQPVVVTMGGVPSPPAQITIQ